MSDGPLTVIIDSADVLCADLESPSKSYDLIATLLSNLLARPSESHGLFHTLSPFRSIFPIPEPSRLILHFATSSPLHDLVVTPPLSPTLAHIIAHPPALLVHLATEQLMPPPPASTPDRFWPVFAPLSARTWEVERIVLGPGCVGLSDDAETVLQVITRGRGKNVERDLDGWTVDGPCALTELDSLKSILEDKGKPEWAEVSKASLRVLRRMTCFEQHLTSFNLNLTPEQRESRAKVPLPYAHKGTICALSSTCYIISPAIPRKDAAQSPAAILYDPDSADDIDDDDPDEDLDI